MYWFTCQWAHEWFFLICFQIRDVIMNVLQEPESPLSSSLLVANLTLLTSHFNEQQNALLLKCTATIDTLYQNSTNLRISYRKEPISERGKLYTYFLLSYNRLIYCTFKIPLTHCVRLTVSRLETFFLPSYTCT